MTDRDLARIVALQKAVLAEAKAVHDASRLELIGLMEQGERVGTADVGFCTLSQPKPAAEVEDREQLEMFATAEGAAELMASITDHQRAVEVLAEHAPHLIKVESVVPGWWETEAKARALKGELIPGVVVKPGRPVLSVRPAESVKSQVRDLLSGGLLHMLEAGS